jgi:hypothetical protein
MEPKEDTKSSPQKEGAPRPKRFLNGWTKEQERLMSEWSDIAMCYRWLHDQSEKSFHKKTMWISLPVIILSTLGGTANFGISSVFEDDTSKKYASFAIGGISLLAGLMTTIGNYLRYPQMEEAHRVASVSWGKLQRLVAIELALHPNDRIDSLDFLKISRAELDRLIEQSPPIPSESIHKFEEKFGHIRDLKKPDICGALEHTMVYESSEERLKQLAVDAALMLKHRRNALNELTTPAVQDTIKKQVAIELETALEQQKQKLKEDWENQKKEEEKTKEAFDLVMEERKKKIKEEIDTEKRKMLTQSVSNAPRASSASSASSMESRLNYNRNIHAISVPGPLPPPISRRGSIPSPPLSSSTANPSHAIDIPPMELSKNLIINPLFERDKILQQNLDKYGDLSKEDQKSDVMTQT